MHVPMVLDGDAEVLYRERRRMIESKTGNLPRYEDPYGSNQNDMRSGMATNKQIDVGKWKDSHWNPCAGPKGSVATLTLQSHHVPLPSFSVSGGRISRRIGSRA